ncbi:carbohydrate-binding protein [Paenibacillus sp. FSL R5-0908]
MKQVRVWFCTICSVILVFSFAVSALAYSHPGGIVTADEFAVIKAKVNANLSPWKEAYNVMMRDADNGLLVQNHAVATWNVPGFYADPAGHIAAKGGLEQDTQAAYAGALAYRFTGDAKYADKAVELMNAWAVTNKAMGMTDAPLASAYVGVGMINAADLLKDYSGWRAAEQAQFQSWIRAVWLPKWIAHKDENNWGDWMRYAKLAFYHYTDNETAFNDEVVKLKNKIDEAIDDRSFLPAEGTRGSNSMWYHYFALSPMTASAEIVLHATGEDLFHWESPSGKSLKKASDNLLYYANGHVSEWPNEYGGKQVYSTFLNNNSFPLNMYEALADIYQDPQYEIYVSPYRPIGGNINGDTGFYHNHAWVYPTLLRTSVIELPDPGYVKVEAEDYTGREKIGVVATADEGGGQAINSTDNGDYVFYNYLNLGKGVNYFDFRYATPETDGSISIRYGSQAGPELGYVDLPATGSWTQFETIRVPLTGASGIKNIYLVFTKQSSGTVAYINWFSYKTDDNEPPLLSSNANLVWLAVNGVQLEQFVRTNTTYTMKIPADAAVPVISAAVADSKAAFSIEQAASLPGVARVRITAENGTTTKLYSIWFSAAEASDSRSIRIEAEDYAGQSGTATANVTINNTEIIRKVGSTDNNDYLFYKDLDFGAGVPSLKVRYATPYTDSNIEVHDGSATGPLLGTVTLAKTGDWLTFKTMDIVFRDSSGNRMEVGGIKNIYVVFRRTTGAVGDIDWFSYAAKIPAVAANNSLSASDVQTMPGAAVTLRALGDRQQAAGEVVGDERFLPAGWSAGENGGITGIFTFNESSHVSEAVYTPAEAGSHTVTASFRKEIWNGTAWTDSGAADSKSITLTVRTASGPDVSAALLSGPSTLHAGQNAEWTVGLTGLGSAEAGFNTADLVVNYDPAVLEFETDTDANGHLLLKEGALQITRSGFQVVGTAVKPEAGQIRIMLVRTGEAPAAENGSLFQLSGKVKADASASSTTVSLSEFSIVSEGQTTVLDTGAAAVTSQIVLADKTALNNLIAEAKALLSASTVGMQPGQYPQAAADALQTAVDAAQAVADDANANAAAVGGAVGSLQSAMNTFRGQVIPQVPGADKTELTALIGTANGQLARSVEGSKVGQYTPGSKAALQTAITAAQAVVNQPSATEAQVAQAKTALSSGLQQFSKAIITMVDGATQVTLLDLSIIARYFGITPQDAHWSEISKADMYDEHEITIRALAAVARLILDDWLAK